jgi:hypothetical protein
MIRHQVDSSIFYYIPEFISSYETNHLIEKLKSIELIPSYKYNNGVSRKQKWIHFEGKYFCSEWKVKYPQWESGEIEDFILELKNKIQIYIENITDIKKPNINSCLINKYENGDNFISPHRDCQLAFGIEPTIIGLSFGETRQIDFIHNINQNKDFSFNLENGSLFIMAGSSQIDFKHTIKKNNSKNERFSLTFREHLL